MVGEKDRNAIVVDGLFVNVDFQVGEGEDRWYMTFFDMLHCRLTFYCARILSMMGSSESENVSMRIFPILSPNFSLINHYQLSSIYNLIVFTSQSLLDLMANIENLPFLIYLLLPQMCSPKNVNQTNCFYYLPLQSSYHPVLYMGQMILS